MVAPFVLQVEVEQATFALEVTRTALIACKQEEEDYFVLASLLRFLELEEEDFFCSLEEVEGEVHVPPLCFDSGQAKGCVCLK